VTGDASGPKTSLNERSARLAHAAPEQALVERLSLEAMCGHPSGVSAMAMVADRIRCHFGVESVSVWRLAGKGRLRLTASSRPDGSLFTTPVSIYFDEADLRAIDEVGHRILSPSKLARNFRHDLPSEARALVVRLSESEDYTGFLSITSNTFRSWTETEIEELKSVAPLVRTLAVRLWMEELSARREATLDMVNRVSTVAAGADCDTSIEAQAGILSILREFLGADGAGIWIRRDDDYLLEMRIDADDVVFMGDGESVTPDVEKLRELKTRGYEVAEVGSINTNFPPPHGSDVTTLIVATGALGDPGKVLSIPRSTGRRWTDEEISGARSVAGVIEQMSRRFAAEMDVRRRLDLEAIVSSVASDMANVTVDNIDEKLEHTLSMLVESFDIDIASIWRHEGDRSLCRMAIDSSGHCSMEGVTAPSIESEVLADRGWVFLPVRELSAFADIPGLEDSDSRALVCGYSGPDCALGSLALIDRTRQRWTDDEIKITTSIARLMGNVRLRMIDARRIAKRRLGDEILISMSQTLLRLGSDEAGGAIDEVLEQIRAHLGLASVAVWELGAAHKVFDCPCEATESGVPIVGDVIELTRAAEVVDAMRASGGPVEWPLERAGESRHLDGLVAFPVLLDDDAAFLSALPGCGQLDEDARTMLGTAAGILAQLRRRFTAERLADLRQRAEKVINGILISFLRTSPGDEIDPVSEAFSEVGKLLHARSLELWELAPNENRASRSEVWRSDPSVRLPSDGLDSVSLHHPDVEAIATLASASEVELEGNLDGRTRIGSPLIIGDRVVGGLLLDIDSSVISEPELDVMKGVLDSFAAIIAQLRARLAAESMLVRKLDADRRLQLLAAQLVRSRSDDADAAASAFEVLVDKSIEIDHASLWKLVSSAEETVASLVNEASHGEVSSIPDDASRVSLEPSDVAALRRYGHLISQWPLDEAPEQVKAVISGLVEPGPRQVMIVGQTVDDSTSAMLLVSRGGSHPFDQVETDFLNSAISILAEHDSRVTAEQWFTKAIAFAPVAISMRDKAMRLISCNPAYEALTGRSLEEMRGSDLHQVLSESDAIHHQMRQEQQPTADHTTDEIRYTRPDGSTSWGRVTSTAVELPGYRDPLRLTYIEDITNSRRRRELLQWQATHDELTALPNRRLFLRMAKSRLEESRDHAMLVLDLDRFKVVNDSLGHGVGDQLLITCSDRIRLSLRPGDLVCRLGGDEFAILLTSPADMGTAVAVAERLLALLREPARIADMDVFPSASIGIATPGPDDDVDDLLRHADAAMYQSKAQGRDRWTGFDVSMREAVLDRIRTETDLRMAIENGQLEVHYQPEVLLSTGEIVGAEALVRWRHPDWGLLTAGSFINVAEESGIVVDLGRRVLHVATKQAAEWISQGHDIIMRVNLSARQVRAAVVAEVEEALQMAGLAPDRLCLELTETAIMDDIVESELILSQLHDLGVKLAIDDFGTGFSSLAYLKRLPVDILKIDRSFVDGVGVDPDDTSIVKSVIGLARTLNLEVVAEGIEDATQVRELLQLGCERGQGFHLARPAPADDIELLLERSRLT